MVIVSGSIQDYNVISSQYTPDSIQMKAYKILSSSERAYAYDSFEQLDFELGMRSNTVKASIDLDRSSFSFRVFRKSYCNPVFWERTNEGGFRLKENAVPSDAINDIYKNSSKYGTECATAMVIVFYKGLLDTYPEVLFNELFKSIYLMDWQQLDANIDINSYIDVIDYLPGDCRYFKNPDVDPVTPEWQGENVIDLSDGYYYGHGIGIGTREKMIRVLNEYRKAGSTTTAYLLDMATRPNYMQLFYLKAYSI